MKTNSEEIKEIEIYLTKLKTVDAGFAKSLQGLNEAVVSQTGIKRDECRKRTSVYQEIESLENSCNALDAELKLLSDALQPILSKEGLLAGVLEPMCDENDSDLTKMVIRYVARVKTTAAYISSIRGRIQIQ